MPQPLRYAIIGAGGISLMHAKHLKVHPDVHIVAAADPAQKALDRFKGENPDAQTFHDWRYMLDNCPEIDAVGVCTPNGMHAENTIAALEAGKHVLVEKPMAMHAADCQRMLDAAKAANRHLVVGFQFRFDPKTQFIRKQVAEGRFGDILYVRCQALRRRGIPNWGVFGRKDLQGGGPMIDIGVHLIEMGHYAMGSPKPTTVTGNAWTFAGNKPSEVEIPWPNWDHATYTVEDMAVGMVRFETGALLTIESCFVGHIEKDVWSFEIVGTKGGATWDPPAIHTDWGGYMVNVTPGFIKPGGWEVVWAEKMRHFAEVVRGERANDASGEQGLMVQQMLDGVYASAEAKREVSVAGSQTV